MPLRNIILATLILLSCGIARAQDTIVVTCSQDYYAHDALLSVAIDGKVVTASSPCPARNPAMYVTTGTPTVLNFTGNYGGSTVAHTVVVSFLNDAYGGATLDSNLYVWSVVFDGLASTPTGIHGIWSSGGLTFTTPIASPIVVPPAVGPTGGFSLVCSSAGTYTLGIVSITCSGVGVVHSVVLNWTASTSAPNGYIIYRGAVKGGPYTKIGTTSALTFSDLGVAAGQSYYYVVTAYLPACVSGPVIPCGESAYSTEAIAAIPAP